MARAALALAEHRVFVVTRTRLNRQSSGMSPSKDEDTPPDMKDVRAISSRRGMFLGARHAIVSIVLDENATGRSLRSLTQRPPPRVARWNL